MSESVSQSVIQYGQKTVSQSVSQSVCPSASHSVSPLVSQSWQAHHELIEKGRVEELPFRNLCVFTTDIGVPLSAEGVRHLFYRDKMIKREYGSRSGA